MSADQQPTAYGRIFAPREEWLARAPSEAILEPGLAIVDTHHHLWSAPGRYLVADLLADTASGHNVEATVFIDCRQSYRTDGPIELRPVGEVEYIARLAAQSDAEQGRKTRVAAGIVGYADLALGERVEPVLRALIEAGGGRFRGVRNSAGWHADPVIGNNHHDAGPGHYLRADFRAGLNRLTRMGLSLDALVYHHQHADLSRSGTRLSRREHHRQPHGHAAGLRSIRGQAEGGLRAMARDPAGARRLPERRHEARRHDDAARRLRLQRAAGPAELGAAGGVLAPVH